MNWNLAKLVLFRSNKLLKAAKGQSCVRCNTDDGTIVAAHYSGVYSNRLGRGKGIKPHDFCCADLCSKCHAYFDQYESPNDDSRAAEFMLMILLTLYRRFTEGDIKT